MYIFMTILQWSITRTSPTHLQLFVHLWHLIAYFCGEKINHSNSHARPFNSYSPSHLGAYDTILYVQFLYDLSNSVLFHPKLDPYIDLKTYMSSLKMVYVPFTKLLLEQLTRTNVFIKLVDGVYTVAG